MRLVRYDDVVDGHPDGMLLSWHDEVDDGELNARAALLTPTTTFYTTEDRRRSGVLVNRSGADDEG